MGETLILQLHVSIIAPVVGIWLNFELWEEVEHVNKIPYILYNDLTLLKHDNP